MITVCATALLINAGVPTASLKEQKALSSAKTTTYTSIN